MARATGLGSQLGAKTESSYNTPVTVDTFHPFLSETLDYVVTHDEDDSLRADTTLLKGAGTSAVGEQGVAGDINMRLYTKGFGFWLLHMFGGKSTAQPDSTGSPTVYRHTFTPASLGGKSFTAQIGWTDLTPASAAKTVSGCKIASWEIAASVGELGSCTVTIDAASMTHATAKESASYAANAKGLAWKDTTITVNGQSQFANGVSIKCDNGIGGKFYLGSNTKTEPTQTQVTPTVTVDADWNGWTEWDRISSGAEVTLVTTFTGAAIDAYYNHTLVLTQNVRMDKGTPLVSGPDYVAQAMEFSTFGSFSAVYTTTDSSVA